MPIPSWKARQVSALDVEIGFRIRKIRQQKNITQSDLAKKLGISFQQLQKYELGHNRVSAARIIDIAQIFEVTPNDILQVAEINQTAEKSANENHVEHLWRSIRSARIRQSILVLIESISREIRST
jgi:transcriptional regulator with XRE-family HTH domain